MKHSRQGGVTCVDSGVGRADQSVEERSGELSAGGGLCAGEVQAGQSS